MTAERDDPGRVFSLLVADALEALIPQVDEWAAEAERTIVGGHARAYADAYRAGVRRMAAETKDQLIDRMLRLRAPNDE